MRSARCASFSIMKHGLADFVLTEVVRFNRGVLLTALLFFCAMPAVEAEALDRETLATRIEPPNELGEKLSDKGIWSIRDRTGKDSGFVFETGTLAPLPGFSGAPINVQSTYW